MPNEMIISFKEHHIPAVREVGRILVRVCHIWQTLGVPERTVWRILKRDADFFVEGVDTDFVTEQTPGGRQKVKVLTHTGLRILALRANTPQAREFQVFIAGVMRGEVRIREMPQPSLPLPGTHRLGRAETRMLDAIEATADDPAGLRGLIADLRTGARVLEPDPVLAELAAAHQTARAAVSQATQAIKAVERQARLHDYTMDQVRQAAGTRAPALPPLAGG